MAATRDLWGGAAGTSADGYEIHMGATEAVAGALDPLLVLDGRPDGAVSANGRVAGCYLHGLFHNDALRQALLAGLGRAEAPARTFDREREFDRLAQHVRSHLDMDAVRALLWPGRRTKPHAVRAMGDVWFVTGGARSGKSRFAERLATGTGREVVYLATMEPLDDELRDRVAQHRAVRPSSWQTIEAPRDPIAALAGVDTAACVLLDCLSLWVTNRLLEGGEEPALDQPARPRTGARC